MINENGAQNAKNDGWTFEEFRALCIVESERFGSNRKAAKYYGGINSGHFTRVIKYRKESNKLRRAMGCPKHPPVDRLIINNCPPEIKAWFEAQRGELSRVEHLVNLMRRDYGELPY